MLQKSDRRQRVLAVSDAQAHREHTLCMLGRFELRGDGRALPLGSRKAEALLALLALHTGQALRRERICAMLWPDVRGEQGRHSLRQTLLHLRKLLPGDAPPLFEASAHSIALHVGHLRVDVYELELALDEGSLDSLQRAVALYRGELLEGLSLGEAPFDAWLCAERKRLGERMASGLARLHELHSAAGDWSAALEVVGQWLQLDPLCEAAHRSAMRLHALQGRRNAALQQYHSLVRSLRQELGCGPDAESTRLYAELIEPRLRPASDPASASPLVREPALAVTVGRAAARARLAAALEHASGDAAAVCVVLGEAGVGKSHLCEQLVATAAADGARVVRVRCFESEQVFPFAVWARVLRSGGVLEQPELLEPLSLAQRAELALLLPELAADTAQRSELLSLLFGLQRLIAGLAARAPLVIWLDDLHWADEMSLRALCFLSRPQACAARCFVVGSARDDQASMGKALRACLEELEREQALERLVLGPLSKAETIELIGRMHGSLGLPAPNASRVAQLWAMSEGNPLVVVESVQALAAGPVAHSVELLPVPDRVRAVILSRVDRLDAPARSLLSLAAVVGRELDLGLLHHATGGTEQLLDALDELVASRFLAAREQRLCFSHDRVRETVYATLPPTQRMLLHARVASALEHKHAAALDDVRGLLGYHHSAAGNSAAAVSHLTRFAELAWRAHGVSETLAALERAAADAEGLPEAQRAHAAIEIVIRQALGLTFHGRLAVLVQRLRAQQPRLAALGDSPLAAQFHFWSGYALSLLGECYEAETHARCTLTLAEASGDARTASLAHALLAYVSWDQGRFAEGVRHGSLATAALDDSDPLPEGKAIACLGLALNQLRLGRWREALASAERTEALGIAHDSNRVKAMGVVGVAYVLASTRQWSLAQAEARRALALSQEPFTLALSLLMLGTVQVGDSETTRAIALLEQVLEQVERNGVRGWATYALTHLANAQLSAGDPTSATRSATRALELARAARSPVSVTMALRALGRGECSFGHHARARALLDEALAVARELAAPFEIAETMLVLADLERASGGSGADEWVRLAREIFAELDLDGAVLTGN